MVKSYAHHSKKKLQLLVMKIGIDIRAAVNPKDGKGWYAYHVVKELLALDRNNNYILYTNRLADEFAVFQNAHIKVIHKKPYLWHFAVIKDWKNEVDDSDLFFAPTSYIIPALLSKKYRSVITVHDLVSFLHPQLHQTKATLLEHLFFKKALKKTTHALVPSENTKRDLMAIFRYPGEKITVTPLGVDERFFQYTGYGMRDTVKGKYHLPKEFILTVSGLEPRKNIGILIDALLELVKRYPDLKLVIVGGKGWKSKENEKKIEHAKNHIIWIQNVAAEDLPAFYGLAKVFVFPSLYEGFGLPPLEAFASGCPVICSNAASLPEVVGDAALLFNPYDRKMLITHIENVLQNKDLREKLIELGKKRAEEFPWKKTAEKTSEVFNT